MDLTSEISKIKRLIVEISSKSHGVAEFLKYVESYPEVLDYLKFESMKDLEDYIMDSTIKEFDELRSEAQSFIERRKRYLNSEMDEFQRAAQDLSRDNGIEISVSQLMDIFQNAKETTVSDEIWNRLENSECNQIKKGEMKKVIELAKRYNKQDPRELKKAILSGDYRRPLILKIGDRYHLVAGNTRLCTAAALGIKPKVLVGDISNI